jgi:hypothetical protein
MMNWVTDHRALFVQWGNAVANVFRSVVVVAKSLWGIFKNVIDALANSFQKALGTNFHSFDELLNVLSFKISAIIIYMNLLVERMDVDLSKAFDWILGQGKQIINSFTELLRDLADSAVNTGAIQASMELLKAAVEGFTSVLTDGFITNLTKLIHLVFNPNLKGDNMTTALNSVKNLINVLVPTVNSALGALTDGFVSGASEIMTPLRRVIDNLTNMMLDINTEEGQKAFKALGNIGGTALSGVVGLIETLSKSFESLVGNLFKKNDHGDSIGTVMESLSGSFNSFTNIVGSITEGFFSGFVGSLNSIMTPIGSLFDTMKGLLELIEGKDKGGGLGAAFNVLGKLLGTSFLIAITNIATVFESIFTTIKNIVDTVEIFGSDTIKGFDKVPAIIKAIGENNANYFKREKGLYVNVFKSFDFFKEPYNGQMPESSESLHDAIITKTGRIIKTDPDDTIIAVKNLFGGKETKTTNAPITINFGNTYVTVTEGNAERAGQNYGRSFVESFMQSISTQMLREGY